MTKIPFALEMYSVRNEFTANPLETMRAIKAMGYTGVEFAGKPQFCAEFYAGLLAETGLVCCGWHTPWDSVQPDTIEATIKLNQAVGNPNVVVPWLPAETLDDWKARAIELNAVAERLAPLGMRTGYHNHNREFKAENGVTPWDVFMKNADPAVIMQLDLGNALSGGCDIMATLNRYPGRCRTIHLKPYHTDPAKAFRPIIGEDSVPWKDVFDFCTTKGNTDWYVIEYECPELPALEAVKQCLEGAKAIQG